MFALPAFAQDAGGFRRNVVDAPTYEELRSLSLPELRQVLDTMPGQAVQDAWTAHLLAFLAAHPELSDDQRDVVFQGLGLVASGIFNIDHADPRWVASVDAPIRRLLTRARAVMPRELVVAAFFTLRDGAPSAAVRPGNLRIPVSNAGNCDCSSLEPYCDDINLTCRTGGRRPDAAPPDSAGRTHQLSWVVPHEHIPLLSRAGEAVAL